MMTCRSVMEVLRNHKDSLMAVLEAFVYDPLLNWRLIETGNKSKKAKATAAAAASNPSAAAAAGAAPGLENVGGQSQSEAQVDLNPLTGPDHMAARENNQDASASTLVGSAQRVQGK